MQLLAWKIQCLISVYCRCYINPGVDLVRCPLDGDSHLLDEAVFPILPLRLSALPHPTSSKTWDVVSTESGGPVVRCAVRHPQELLQRIKAVAKQDERCAAGALSYLMERMRASSAEVRRSLARICAQHEQMPHPTLLSETTSRAQSFDHVCDTSCVEAILVEQPPIDHHARFPANACDGVRATPPRIFAAILFDT